MVCLQEDSKDLREWGDCFSIMSELTDEEDPQDCEMDIHHAPGIADESNFALDDSPVTETVHHPDAKEYFTPSWIDQINEDQKTLVTGVLPEVHITMVPDWTLRKQNRNRDIPVHKREALRTELKKMLDEGIIEASKAGHNAIAMLVPKPNGKIRVVVD